MNNTLEIKIQDLKNLNKEEYLLVDIREEAAFAHGFIPNAVNIPLSRLREKPELLPNDKKIILYCAKGILSYEAAEELEEKGYDVAHLAGGYGAWLLDSFSTEERYPEIEKSIRKKFHKTIFSRFTKAINEYELVKEGDKIAVCISGGKDSMLMAKLFQELQKHRKVNFDVVFLVMDPGYNETNRKVIEENARLLNIPITIFETSIFETV